jgi:hypothetical protein
MRKVFWTEPFMVQGSQRAWIRDRVLEVLDRLRREAASPADSLRILQARFRQT